MTVIEKIEAQQAPIKEKNRYAWVLGEQLKEICEREPESAVLVERDMDIPEMSIVNAEKEIAKFAKKHGGAVTGPEADKIIRKFYGLPQREEQPQKADGVIDLADFM